ncbi:MAG: hypothetical protein WBJ84_06835 [Bacteroidales bacterium]
MLKFIAIILLVSLLIRLSLRYFLSRKFNSWMYKQQQNYQGKQEPAKPEGSIHITYQKKSGTSGNKPDQEGEYVDFVEINDNN